MNITDTEAATRVYVGPGTTLTNYVQRGGINVLSAAATITKVQVDSGELDIEGGDFQITELELNGGTVRDKHSNGASAEWVTIDMNAGTLDLTGTDEARTVTTLDWTQGLGDLIIKWDKLTVTNFTLPGAEYQLTGSRTLV